MLKGSQWAVSEGYGVPGDVAHCEEKGSMNGADPAVRYHRRHGPGAFPKAEPLAQGITFSKSRK